ncbi:MAG TPA: hypothetical protein DIC34_02425 [Treponema sp.]|nr:hypothetical protein [Treponema sp.]
MIEGIGKDRNSRSIEELKRLINDKDYLSDAIGRIAQVLSDELLCAKIPGAPHERDRETPQRSKTVIQTTRGSFRQG